jgi:Xaa-Pro aminopeptidase
MSFVLRRDALLNALGRPLVLFSGSALSRNYPANTFPFRADSNFLYFFDRPEPGSAALFDPGDKTVTLFLPERSMDDALWHGELESFESVKARQSVHAVLPVEGLERQLEAIAKGRQLDSLAVADFKATARARGITGKDLQFDDAAKVGPPDVLDAIASLRLKKGPDELAEMRKTAVVTQEAHLAAMKASKPGVKESYLAGLVEGAFARSGCSAAYGTILSVRGEVLHNHHHGNTLANGDIVLLDAGAENAAGYCSDVTRCWPVGGPFSAEGRDVYDLVLQAELQGIAQVKPKARYRDLHLSACRVLAQGLVDMGLLIGNADSLVEAGAHAMFFPHGLGHQIGLDVHDLEAFGDRVHYPMGRTRSTQFGLASLRMDMDLEDGMVFSIEPGLYFVPAILRSPDFRQRFKGQVNFEKAERFLSMNGGRGFGGIRIEDDVLCTSGGAEVLTAAIPKRRSEIEALVGQG